MADNKMNKEEDGQIVKTLFKEYHNIFEAYYNILEIRDDYIDRDFYSEEIFYGRKMEAYILNLYPENWIDIIMKHNEIPFPLHDLMRNLIDDAEYLL